MQPRLYLLKGELLLTKERDESAAEACFKIALRHRSVSTGKVRRSDGHHEPRPACGQAGKRDEARATLAEIYCWFTEGFGTTVLKDAKALLD